MTGKRPSGSAPDSRVFVIDARCAAVECVDLFLQSGAPLVPKTLRYSIRASAELEYFVPERNVPVRLAGRSELQVSVPPYCGRRRLYLGRAVSLKHSEFSVQEEK